jgi:TM2 domain-containing membrane protein YozV
LCSAFCLSAQNDYQDVVYLKDGSIIRGMIIEQIPYKTLKIETVDGSVFVCAFDDIEKITKEQAVKRQNINRSLTEYSDLKYTFGKRINPQGDLKSPFLAGFLSFLIPGVGQFYNNDYVGGAIFLGADWLSFSLLLSSLTGYYTDDRNETAVLLAITSVTIKIWSIINAYKTAKKVNKARGYYIGNGTYLNVSPTLIKPDLALAKKSVSPYKEQCLGLALQLNF